MIMSYMRNPRFWLRESASSSAFVRRFNWLFIALLSTAWSKTQQNR